MFNPSGIGERIKFYRKRAGMTQTELAEKMHVSFQAVSCWETGGTLPDIENLCNLAVVFNESVDELLRKQENDGVSFMIGIDGGGTSTEFALFSSEGHIFKTLKLQGSNSSTVGIDGALNILFEGIDICLQEGKPVKAIFVGIAGENYDELKKGLEKRYPDIDIRVDSDGVSALFSAEGDVALICGTGSILLKKEGEHFKTIGGWGYLYGDPGSAFSFGKEAIRVSLWYENGGETSQLIHVLLKERLNVKESFLLGAEINVANVARQASVIFEAYKMGDKIAEEIINKQMQELNQFIELACPGGGKIIACGGIFEHYGEIILPILKKHVRDNISFVLPTLPPIYGSCKACFDFFNVKEGENFYNNFYSDYTKRQVKDFQEK